MNDPRSLPVVLVILDGWGIGPPGPGNAIHAAATPTMDRLLDTYPNATLRTSGEDVGLPDSQMGNSEVGHLNIGAGHVVYQWITRIDKEIRDGEFFRNEALRSAFERAAARSTTVHLMGLVSDGGVHSHLRHLEALIELAAQWPGVRIRIHAFTDGRDTAPDSGIHCIARLQDRIDHSTSSDIAIASVSGRYYAMDRDNRWERERQAFDVITGTSGDSANDAFTAVRRSYTDGISDEFVVPVRIGDWGSHGNRIEAGDEAIVFNFRADRAREIVHAIALPDFDKFDRGNNPGIPLSTTTMTRYEVGLPVRVAYHPTDVAYPIARIVSDAGLRQFHAAETEKYPHVTFFLNGGREEPFPGEDRKLIPSPRVATYDLQPEMSAASVCDAVVDAIRSRDYAFIMVNFANPDMVGHTGDIDAAIAAVETVDRCVDTIVAAIQQSGGVALISADHGNAEEMLVPGTDEPMTAHTTNPVPVVLVAPDGSPLRNIDLRRDARLSALGTTVIDLLGLPRHPDMTEPSLLQR